MKTLSDLASIVQEFVNLVDAWDNSEGPYVPFRGGQVKSITKALETGICRLAETVQSAEFQESAYPLVFAIDKFVEATFDWANRRRDAPQDTDPQGGTAVWTPYQQMKLAMKPKVFSKLEPLAAVLKLPNMTYAHAAKMYGFIDDNGNPEEWKIEQEVREPGSHITAEFQNPEEVRYAKIMQAKWQDRLSRLGTIMAVKPENAISAREKKMLNRDKWKSPTAKEPIEQLLSLPNMTIAQVAQMKGMTEEEVTNIAVQLRIPIDATVMAEIAKGSMDAARGLVDSQTELASSLINSYPNITKVEERIWAMMDDGHHIGKILNALKPTNPTLLYEQVLEIMGNKPVVKTATKQATRKKAANVDDSSIAAAAVSADTP